MQSGGELAVGLDLLVKALRVRDYCLLVLFALEHEVTLFLVLQSFLLKRNENLNSKTESGLLNGTIRKEKQENVLVYWSGFISDQTYLN